ncbi:cytokinesis protein 3 [Nowakowskiella sp. JEL0407]|nr:cytokinesis protein 3 [Nowakowskiella sp. JEL0407]
MVSIKNSTSEAIGGVVTSKFDPLVYKSDSKWKWLNPGETETWNATSEIKVAVKVNGGTYVMNSFGYNFFEVKTDGVYKDDVLECRFDAKDLIPAEPVVHPVPNVSVYQSSIQNYTHDVMLSYCWAQKDTVLRIRDALVARHFTVWLDESEMQGNIYAKMQEAIRNSAVIIVCLSSQYEQSANCTREISYAADVRKPIVPVRLDAGPFRFSDLITAGAIYVDLKNVTTADWSNRMDILAKNIRHHFKEKFTYGKLYHTLYQSNSFATKKYCVEMKVRKENFTDELVVLVLSRDIDGNYDLYTLEEQPSPFPKSSDFTQIAVEGISSLGSNRIALVLKSQSALLLKLNNDSPEKSSAIERYQRYEDTEETVQDLRNELDLLRRTKMQTGKIYLTFSSDLVRSTRDNIWGWCDTRMCTNSVTFPTPFNEVPTVTTSVYMIDTDHKANTRVYVEARDITKEGFTATAHTWADSTVHYVGITWVAFAASA